jgi:hypothetical protein
MRSRLDLTLWGCFGAGLLVLVFFSLVFDEIQKFNGFFSGYALNLHYQAIAVSLVDSHFPPQISDFIDGGIREHYYVMHGYTPFLYPLFALLIQRELGITSIYFIFILLNLSLFFTSLWLILRKNYIIFAIVLILFSLSPPFLASISVVGYESLSTILLSLIILAYSRLSAIKNEPYWRLFFALIFMYGISSWFGFFTVVCLFFLRLILPARVLPQLKKTIGFFFFSSVSAVVFVLSLMLAGDFMSMFQDALSRSLIATRSYADVMKLSFALHRIAIFIGCLTVPLLFVYAIRYFHPNPKGKGFFQFDFISCLAIIGVFFIIMTLPWSLRHPHSWALAIVPWYIYCGNHMLSNSSGAILFQRSKEKVLGVSIFCSILVIISLTVESINLTRRGDEILSEASRYSSEGNFVCVSDIFPCEGQPKSLFFLLSRTNSIYFSECLLDRNDKFIASEAVETLCSNGRLLFSISSD